MATQAISGSSASATAGSTSSSGSGSASGSSGSGSSSGGTSGGPADAGHVVVAIIGDYGVCGSKVDGGVGSAQTCPDEQAVARLVHGWNPDFVITTGDTCSASASFTSQLGPTAQVTGLRARYYAVELAPFARAYVLDGNPQDPDGNSAGSAQAQWFEGELAGSTAAWNLVFEHEAPYLSCGEYSYRADAGGYTDGTAARLGDPLCDGSVPDLSWIAQPGIDVVFDGHSHVYERLLEPGVAGSSMPSVVVGCSGAGLQGNCGKSLPGQQKAIYRTFGAVRLRLSRHALAAEFVAEDGGVLDSFSLNK